MIYVDRKFQIETTSSNAYSITHSHIVDMNSEEWTLNTDWNIQFMNSKIPDVYFVFSYSFAHIFGHSTKFEFQMLSPFFSVMLSHRLQCDRILRYHILTFDYTLSMNIEQFACANTFEFFCRDRLGYKLPVLPITTKNVRIDRQCKYIPYICFFYLFEQKT